MLHLCTLIFQYDIHKLVLKSQYYYLDLIELQNAPLTLFSLVTILFASYENTVHKQIEYKEWYL
jgi:hypothetical protein